MQTRVYILALTVLTLTSLRAEIHTDSLDAALLYNKGTTAYEQSDMAQAVYNLELAHMLSPYDTEIEHNLRIAKADVAIDIVEIEGFFLKEWIVAMANMLSPGAWSYVTLLLVLVLLALVYRRYLQHKSGGLHSWLSIGLVAVLITATAALGITREQILTSGRYGIVSEDSVQLKEGPDQVSTDVKEVGAGVKVEILDRVGDWYKVAAMDREQGWILSEYVMVLAVEG